MLRKTPFLLLICLLTLVIFYIEPAIANKFETIGSGVSGSPKIKKEYLKVIAFVVGIIMLSSSLLSVLFRKHNAQHLNFTMWKPSSILYLLVGLSALTFGYFL